MNLRRLAVWAVIFASLLAYVLAFEKPAPKPQQPAAQRGEYEKQFDLAQSELAALTITQAGKSVTVSRKNLQWVITDPAGAEALAEQCQAIVAAVIDTVVLNVIADKPVDLKQYGLDAPDLTIAAKADGGKTITLELGKKSPSEVSLYGLDRERGRVVLVGTYISFSAKMFIENVKNLPAK